MSARENVTVWLPSGTEASPITLIQAINTGIGLLEERAKAQGIKIIWDTFEVTTEEEQVDDTTIAGPERSLTNRSMHLSVLTIDQEEAQ